MKETKKNATASKVGAKAQQSQNGVVGSNFMIEVEKAMLNDNVEKTISTLEKMAKSGNAEAAYFLGECFLKGNAFPLDKNKAAYFLVKAAKLGNTEALVALGSIKYANAQTEPEREDVFNDFHQAALNGHPEAEYIIAVFLEAGYGCKSNKELAALWGMKASIDHYNKEEAIEILGLKKD